MKAGLMFLSLLMTIICANWQISNADPILQNHGMGYEGPSATVLEKGESRESDPSEISKDPGRLSESHASQRKNQSGDAVIDSNDPLKPSEPLDKQGNDPQGTVPSWNTTRMIPTVTAVLADAKPQTTSTLCGLREGSLPQSAEAPSDKEKTGQEGDRQELCQDTQANITDTSEHVATSEPIMETETPHRCAIYVSPWPRCELNSTESINHIDFLVPSVTKVSISLFQKIMAKDRNTNVVFSPLSVVLILSHLLLGTRGITKEKLQEALFYPQNNSDCVHAAVNQLGKSKGFVLASKIFHQQDIVFNEFFVNDLKEFYDSAPEILSHDPSGNVQLINNWVAEKTHNKIKKLIDQVPSDVQLILLNAIYLRAKWIAKFKMEHTRKERFHLYGTDKKTVKVAMMNSQKYPLIFFSDNVLRARIGRLRLTDNMSLVIMLPQSPHQNLYNMEKQLSANIFQQVMSRLYKDPIRPAMISIPHIKVDTKLDLLELLDMMDLSDLFYSPNLCGMAADAELAVSSGKHRSVVEVNEEGVEAASASSISLARTFLTFEAREPFTFFVMNDDPVVPVFMGRIVNPAA